MTIVLLLISLLLHVVTFYFIVVLYMKYSTIKNLADSQRNMLEETEQTLTTFLIEIRDENEKLLRNLHNSIQNDARQVNEHEDKMKDFIPLDESQKIVAKETDSNFQHQEELPHDLIGIYDIQDTIEINNFPQKNNTSFEIEAIKLYKNGHTVEQIAKTLNKGKTEIELLLKFNLK